MDIQTFFPNYCREQQISVNSQQTTIFMWAEKYLTKFTDFRHPLHETILWHYFEPTQKTFIYVDTHINDLAATLLQGDSLWSAKIISFAIPATSIEKG